MSANPVKMTRTATVVEGLDLTDTVFTLASEKVDRREIVKKIAKPCRPLISEGRFRNHGADIMLLKSSSVAKSRIG